MATEKELEQAIRELIPILDSINEFQQKYSTLLREYGDPNRKMTEDERNDAAIEMLNKYSNL